MKRRRSLEYAQGMQLMRGSGPISRAWAEAISIDPVEVDWVLAKANQARQIARAMAKYQGAK